MKRIRALTSMLLVCVLVLALILSGCRANTSGETQTDRSDSSTSQVTETAAPPEDTAPPEIVETQTPEIDEKGSYDDKESVALYIHTYGHLPPNYITKAEASALGWSGGSLEKYAPGMCIGGDRFGNREGILPKKKGRVYTECDIDTMGAKSRGAKRIVFSNDGLIYYTDDHYETYTQLY